LLGGGGAHRVDCSARAVDIQMGFRFESVKCTETERDFGWPNKGREIPAIRIIIALLGRIQIVRTLVGSGLLAMTLNSCYS
jgi:hypothetical protein